MLLSVVLAFFYNCDNLSPGIGAVHHAENVERISFQYNAVIVHVCQKVSVYFLKIETQRGVVHWVLFRCFSQYIKQQKENHDCVLHYIIVEILLFLKVSAVRCVIVSLSVFCCRFLRLSQLPWLPVQRTRSIMRRPGSVWRSWPSTSNLSATLEVVNTQTHACYFYSLFYPFSYCPLTLCCLHV